MKKSRKSRPGFNFSEWQEKAVSPFGRKTFLIGAIFLILVIGGFGIYNSPAFHSYSPACVATDYEVKHNLPCGDPQTLIYKATGGNNDLSEFNTQNVIFNSTLPTCGSNCRGMQFQPNSTFPAIGLSKTVIGDLSVISGKELWMFFTWTFGKGVCCGTGKDWMWYLTTNATLPRTAAYHPLDDSSVAMIGETKNVGGSNLGYNLLIQKKAGETLRDELIASCLQAGSCFLTQTASPTPVSQVVNDQNYLNFTGNIQTGNNCNASGVGSGCSSINSWNAWVTTTTLPWFQFQSVPYYLGFFAQAGLEFQPIWAFDAFGSLNINAVVPVPSAQLPPNIDTGGFFGPVIKALISIGVLMLGAVIQFFGFVLTGIHAAFNVIGQWAGIGNLGDNIFSFFGTVLGFINNVFNNFLTWAANSTTLIGNAFVALATLLTVYFTQVGVFFSGVVGFLSLFTTVLSAVLQYGQYPVAFIISLWWIMDIYRSYDEGVEGFLAWVDMSEAVMFKGLNVIIWFGDQTISFIAKLRTILPRPLGV